MGQAGRDKEAKAHIRGEIERGIATKDIAANCNVPANTINRWRKNLERFGQMEAPLWAKGKPLPTEIQTYLLGYLRGRPHASLVEMKQALKEAFGQDIILSAISRTLVLCGCKKQGHNRNLQGAKIDRRNDAKSAPPMDSSPTVQDNSNAPEPSINEFTHDHSVLDPQLQNEDANLLASFAAGNQRTEPYPNPYLEYTTTTMTDPPTESQPPATQEEPPKESTQVQQIHRNAQNVPVYTAEQSEDLMYTEARIVGAIEYAEYLQEKGLQHSKTHVFEFFKMARTTGYRMLKRMSAEGTYHGATC